MSKNTKLIFLILVLISINVGFAFSNLFVFGKFWKDGNAYPSLLVVINIIALMGYIFTQISETNPTYQLHQLFYKNLSFSVFLIFFSLIYWFTIYAPQYSKEGLIVFYMLQFILNMISQKLYINYLRNQMVHTPLRNAVLVGQSNNLTKLFRTLKRDKWLGVHPQKQFKSLDAISEVKRYCLENDIKNLYVDIDSLVWNDTIENVMANWHEELRIDVMATSQLYASKLRRGSYQLINDIPVVKLFSYPLDEPFNYTIKRLFDIFMSIFCFLFIFSWLFPIVALAIIIDSGFPIFFKQKRNGIDNNPFTCYKFRTMKKNKFENIKITVPNDTRITSLGKILRKLSIDELPQFYNVLKGDMSVVGPRPHMLNQDEHYAKIIKRYTYRHNIKPGITGHAQINGFRGPIQSDKDMKNRILADIFYIKNWTFLMDLFIIYKTIFNIIKGDENAI